MQSRPRPQADNRADGPGTRPDGPGHAARPGGFGATGGGSRPGGLSRPSGPRPSGPRPSGPRPSGPRPWESASGDRPQRTWQVRSEERPARHADERGAEARPPRPWEDRGPAPRPEPRDWEDRGPAPRPEPRDWEDRGPAPRPEPEIAGSSDEAPFGNGDRPVRPAPRPWVSSGQRPGGPAPYGARPGRPGPGPRRPGQGYRPDHGYRPDDGRRPESIVNPAVALAADEELVAGRRPVEEAFVARREAKRLLVVPQRRMALEKLVLHAMNLRIPIVEVEGGTLTAVAGFDGHQGIALVVAPRRWAAPDDILALAAQRGDPPLVLVLDSLEDPQNVGTLLRTAEASGVHGAIFPTHRQAPLTPAAVKASAGAVEHLRLAPVDDLPGALADLHARGLRIVGADGDAPLTAREADLRGPLAIVVGSEGQGLGPAVRRRCDLLVRIPMHGHIESLNAAVAGSILLYEAAAQRRLVETPLRPGDPPDERVPGSIAPGDIPPGEVVATEHAAADGTLEGPETDPAKPGEAAVAPAQPEPAEAAVAPDEPEAPVVPHETGPAAGPTPVRRPRTARKRQAAPSRQPVPDGPDPGEELLPGGPEAGPASAPVDPAGDLRGGSGEV